MSLPESNSALPIVFAGVDANVGQIALLKSISLTITPGPPTALIGPNGAGKTSFLKAAMGLIAPTRGAVTWGGGEKAPSKKLAIVFQRPVMLRRSCAGNMHYALAAAGVAPSERKSRMEELLRLVGLEGLADRPARRLSGGEQQRLALARALARRPAVLLLDEPTASLDPAATKAIEDIVRTVGRQGVKVVIATHDLGEARRLAGEIVLLNRGSVIESGPAPEFFSRPATDAAKRFIAGELLA